MIKEKSYKTPNKLNKKKKKTLMDADGLYLHNTNHDVRHPIVALPEIVIQPSYLAYRRFVASSSVSGIITIQDCLNQFMVATTSVLAYCCVMAIRIKKVRCLAPVTTQGTSVTLTMQPAGLDSSNNSFNSVPEVYVDTSASIDVPAYLSLTPSVMTPFGSWHQATTVNQNLLTITAPQGSTLDILFEFVLRWSSPNPSGYTRTIAAGTAGVFYAASILSNFIPADVETI